MVEELAIAEEWLWSQVQLESYGYIGYINCIHTDPSRFLTQ